MVKEKDTRNNMSSSLSSPKDSFKYSAWALWAYGLGLMVMPDNLSLAGKFAGQFGIFAPLILAAGVLIYFSYARSYADLYMISSNADGKDNDGRAYLGSWLVYYPLIVRVLAAIFLATGLTVSGGFVFNEVFVYWFPNFAFAFILLGGLVGFQLLGKAYRKKAQIIFVSTVLLGMAILIVMGLIGSLSQDSVQAHGEQPLGMSGLFVPLLLLMGFDMANFPRDNSSAPPPATAKILKSAIAVFTGLMIFWIMTALLHVDRLRLANTSIAHLIAAREIGGQAGRVIMGVMIIAGACAAVNALFESVARLIKNLSKHGMLPRMKFLPAATMLGMAAVAALLMASGLAGEELLEILIRATLLLWLGKYGLITVQHLFLMCQTHSPAQRKPHSQKRFQLVVTTIITFSGILALALTSDQPVHIFTIMILSIGAVLIMGGIYRLLASRTR